MSGTKLATFTSAGGARVHPYAADRSGAGDQVMQSAGMEHEDLGALTRLTRA